MTINMHAHLVHRDHFSDKYWNNLASELSEKIGITPSSVFENILPKLWQSDADVYIEQMNLAGIDKALIHHADHGLSNYGEPNCSVDEITQWYVNQVSKYPDRLFTIIGCDPRRGDEALALLEKAANEWHIKGVKIYPPAGFYPDDPAFYPFFKKCVDLNLAVHSHCSAMTPSMEENKYADPIFLDSLASQFPKLKIVMVHYGGAALTWSRKCLELMLGRPNMYAEISGGQISASGLTKEWLTLLRNTFDMPCPTGHAASDRIMFGSDWPYINNIMTEKDWVETIKNIPKISNKYGLSFTETEIDKLLYLNAQNFLESLL